MLQIRLGFGSSRKKNSAAAAANSARRGARRRRRGLDPRCWGLQRKEWKIIFEEFQPM